MWSLHVVQTSMRLLLGHDKGPLTRDDFPVGILNVLWDLLP